jgi:hypothetical protein
MQFPQMLRLSGFPRPALSAGPQKFRENDATGRACFDRSERNDWFRQRREPAVSSFEAFPMSAAKPLIAPVQVGVRPWACALLELIDVIYYGGYPTEAGLILRQARDQVLMARFIGADPLLPRCTGRSRPGGRRDVDDLPARTAPTRPDA